jgi:RNA polymerase sigma-70 factor (ECF subfamily)
VCRHAKLSGLLWKKRASSPNFCFYVPGSDPDHGDEVIRARRALVTGGMNAFGRCSARDTVLLFFDPAGIGAVMNEGKKSKALSADEGCRLMLLVGSERDWEAFTTLFDFYAPRLKAFMMRSGMAASVAEDITQETLLLVWRKASYFDPRRAGVSTWIFTIARNVRIDRLRRESRPAAIANAFDPTDMPESPSSGETIAIASEREERVRAAIPLLSEEQGEILRLSYFGDKTQVEIAGELGIPLGTVKSRVRLALGRLRQILDDLK